MIEGTEVFMSLKNLAIALPLENELLTPFYLWGKSFDFNHYESIAFIHIVKKTLTALEFSVIENPSEAMFLEMKPTLEKFLQDEKNKIVPNNYKGEIQYIVSKHLHPDEEMIHFLNNLKSELIVVSTRGKHGVKGLFTSSFTDRMVKLAPCNILVLRPTGEHSL
jgi:nucleotide-binding universal stress UspA family protein